MVDRKWLKHMERKPINLIGSITYPLQLYPCVEEACAICASMEQNRSEKTHNNLESTEIMLAFMLNLEPHTIRVELRIISYIMSFIIANKYAVNGFEEHRHSQTTEQI